MIYWNNISGTQFHPSPRCLLTSLCSPHSPDVDTHLKLKFVLVEVSLWEFENFSSLWSKGGFADYEISSLKVSVSCIPSRESLGMDLRELLRVWLNRTILVLAQPIQAFDTSLVEPEAGKCRFVAGQSQEFKCSLQDFPFPPVLQ